MKSITRRVGFAAAFMALASLSLLAVASPAGSAQFPGVNGKIAYSLSDGTSRSSIHLIAPDGSGDTMIVADGIGSSFDASGTRMSYITYLTQSGNSLHVVNTDGTGDITVASRSGGANIGFSALSPDGSRIAYVVSSNSSYELWISGVDGSNPTNLTNGQFGNIQWPQFSPDGTILSFSGANGPMSNQVFLVDLSTLVVTQLTHSNFGIGYPSWKPDGSGFVASVASGIAPAILMISRDGSTVTTLFDYGTIGVGTFYSVMPSPDGTKLVFMTSVNVPGSLNDPQTVLGLSVWTSNLDGTDATVLVPTGTLDPAFPVWANAQVAPTTTTTVAPAPVTPKITG